MAKVGTTAHTMAMQAKYRLLKNEYNNPDFHVEKSYCLNGRRLSQKEMNLINKRIDRILSSEEFVFDPLKRLIPNKKEFECLTEVGKNSYLIELSNIYNDIKKFK